MKKYDKYIFERDIIKHSKHLFYLCGYVEKENVCYVIASYSFKTDKLLIKRASEHLPNNEILFEFIEYARSSRLKELREESK